jgi:hypothetical protein
MVTRNQSIFLWIFAVVFTLSAAIYQRLTGPTHPKRVSITIKGEEYKFKLLRSHGGEKDATIRLQIPEHISGTLHYKRYKTNDEFETIQMQRAEEKDEIYGYLPHQPPAGKLEYFVNLNDGKDNYRLNEIPVIIRFKGAVDWYILIPHIIFMFLAMLFSLRTGIEAIFKGNRTLKYARITLILLLIGGLILGPIVQLMAFGDLWTGWPFGGDWTDNKTIVAFIFWLLAFLVLRKKPENRFWPILAFLVLFAMYMIPHSMGGSEYDYEKGQVKTGLSE